MSRSSPAGPRPLRVALAEARLLAVGLALLLFAAPARAADPPEPEEPTETKDDDDGTSPDPDPDLHVDDPGDVEGVPAKELPPDGLGHSPTLPLVDRDLINPRQGASGRGSAQLAIAKIGEDWFIDFALRYTFKPDKWRIAPRLPLRLRIIDEPPETSDVVRMEDWDEVSDFARILAYVQYGAVGDPFFFRFGELNGVTIGHGSLVNRYFNTIDIDHYQGGVVALGDAGFMGAEAMLDNVFDPELTVGRVYMRPLHLVERWPYIVRHIKLGVTFGADFTAPLTISRQNGQIFSHPDWEPIVLSDEVMGLFGLDLEVPVVSTPHLDVVPYIDVATVDGKGVGVHVGSYFNVRFDPEVILRTRVEYRHQGQGYVPGYISPFYEVERYSHHGGLPKLGRLREGVIGDRHSGFYFEGDFRYHNDVRYTLIYATRAGARGSDLLMRLRLRHLGPVRLTLFFARLGFGGFDDLLEAEQTVWGTTLRVLFFDVLYVSAQVKNEWWLEHKPGGSGFRTDTNFSLGFGVVINL